MIIAIIKPFRLDEVKEALQKAGVSGLTVTEAKGFGKKHKSTHLYRGAEYVVDFLPKVQIMTVVDDNDYEAVMDALQESAHTGRIGDGKIFSLDVAEAMRIRTGEKGTGAL